MRGKLPGCLLACWLCACAGGGPPPASSPPAKEEKSADAYFGVPSELSGDDAKKLAWHVWRGDRERADSLNPDDRLHLARAQNRAKIATLNESVEWRNPKTGNGGTITPLKDGYDAASRICRKFSQVNVIKGLETKKIGIACKDFSGQWFIVEEE